MKFFSITAHALMVAVALTLTSCSDDGDGAADGSGRQTVPVTLTLAVSDADGGTRAGTWGDDDYDTEEATVWESTVEAGRLQVLVYDMSDECIGQVSNITFKRQTGTDRNLYTVSGAFSVTKTMLTDGKLSCRFVVLANYDSEAQVSSGAPLTDIAANGYQYAAASIAAGKAYIPMWGTRTYSGSDALTLEEGVTTDAGKIYLLRAMSKIRVRLSDDMASNFTLSGATLSDYSRLGYVIPAGFAGVADTRGLYYSGSEEPLSFHPRYSPAGAALSFNALTAGKSYVLYVPEYKSTLNADGTTDPFLSVTIAPKGLTTDTGTYRINLRQYVDGTAQDGALNLIRNTVYDYVITNVGSTLTLKYQAIDWTTGGGDVTFE